MSGLTGNARFVGFPGDGNYGDLGIQIFPTAAVPAGPILSNNRINADFTNGRTPASGMPRGVTSMTGSEQCIVSFEAQTPEDVALLNAFELLVTLPKDLQGPSGIATSRAIRMSGISALNIRMAYDWQCIQQWAAANDGSARSQMAIQYLKEGEDYFLGGEPDATYETKRFATVMRDEKLEAFRCASLLGHSRVNLLGVIQNNQEINKRLPRNLISALMVGNTKMRNYWGSQAGPGRRLFFIFTKEYDGPYQLVPWCSNNTSYPDGSLVSYVDCAGKPKISRVLEVAQITHSIHFTESPYLDHLQKALGLMDAATTNASITAFNVSHMNLIETAVKYDGRSLM